MLNDVLALENYSVDFVFRLSVQITVPAEYEENENHQRTIGQASVGQPPSAVVFSNLHFLRFFPNSTLFRPQGNRTKTVETLTHLDS